MSQLSVFVCICMSSDLSFQKTNKNLGQNFTAESRRIQLRAVSSISSYYTTALLYPYQYM